MTDVQFTVLDVGHGACAYLVAGNNKNLMLFDCGHKTDPVVRPSDLLHNMGQRSVERLFISNYDEDHISDLPNVIDKLSVKILHRNKTITSDELRRLKIRQSGVISPAMESMLEMCNKYTASVTEPPEFPGVSHKIFHNNHPFGNGDDTNNISLMTFLTANNTTILLPGDIEREGWLALLSDQDFAGRLASVDIFIASHHGRENGYCREVFADHNCRPDVIVFSDSNIKYATQEMANTYAGWANGIPFNGQDRSVLTTRNDGSLTWTL